MRRGETIAPFKAILTRWLFKRLFMDVQVIYTPGGESTHALQKISYLPLRYVISRKPADASNERKSVSVSMSSHPPEGLC